MLPTAGLTQVVALAPIAFEGARGWTEAFGNARPSGHVNRLLKLIAEVNRVAQRSVTVICELCNAQSGVCVYLILHGPFCSVCPIWHASTLDQVGCTALADDSGGTEVVD